MLAQPATLQMHCTQHGLLGVALALLKTNISQYPFLFGLSFDNYSELYQSVLVVSWVSYGIRTICCLSHN